MHKFLRAIKKCTQQEKCTTQGFGKMHKTSDRCCIIVPKARTKVHNSKKQTIYAIGGLVV